MLTRSVGEGVKPFPRLRFGLVRKSHYWPRAVY
jgi:hypothetical protein